MECENNFSFPKGRKLQNELRTASLSIETVCQKLLIMVLILPLRLSMLSTLTAYMHHTYILNRFTACRFEVCLFISSEQRGFVWLKDRVLEPAQKLSLAVTFVPSKSARPD